MSEHEPEPVDETDEPAKLYISDPDDYAKTRKLKALNDAKATVRQVRKDRPATATDKEWSGLNQQLSEAVASYGHELLPLLEEAEAAGMLSPSDYTTDAIRKHVDVREFIQFDGRLPNDTDTEINTPYPAEVMCVYRQFQTLERKIGLGPSLEEDTDNEWEIET